MASRPELTTADYVSARVERARYDTTGMGQVMQMKAQYEAENAAFVHEQTTVKISKFTLICWVISYFREISVFVSLYKKGIIMSDWKTTISGTVMGLAIVARHLGLDIPVWITDGISAVAIALLGKYATEKKQ